MIAIEHILLGASVPLVRSIVASRLSDKLGVPARLILLIIGMLPGSDGLGGIHFDERRGLGCTWGTMAKQSSNPPEADCAMATDMPESKLGGQADKK